MIEPDVRGTSACPSSRFSVRALADPPKRFRRAHPHVLARSGDPPRLRGDPESPLMSIGSCSPSLAFEAAPR